MMTTFSNKSKIAPSFLSPTMQSALKACGMAEREKGCLVRVTLTDFDQRDVIRYVVNYLANHHLFDSMKTLNQSLTGNPLIELTNGSGIEFVIDAKGSGK